MSAFVVSPACMHRVVHAVARKQGLLDCFAGLTPTEIGRCLYAMNIDAVQQRYPETKTDPDNLPGWKGCHLMPTTYKYEPPPIAERDLLVCLAAMRCLEYQCSEGDVPDSPLCADLSRAIGYIACSIVERLPAYDAIPWD